MFILLIRLVWITYNLSTNQMIKLISIEYIRSTLWFSIYMSEQKFYFRFEYTHIHTHPHTYILMLYTCVYTYVISVYEL